MKRRHQLLYIIIVCLALFNILFAQHFPIKYYTEEEGLPDGYVSHIQQDNSGKLWFATKSGIGIFDGSKWAYLNNSNGLKNQNVFKIQFDSLNRLWALSINNNFVISYYENNKWTEIPPVGFKIDNDFKVTDFNVQIIDGEPVIFVGTESSGLFVYKHGYWSNFTKDFGLPSSSINSIEFFNGLFYVGTTRGAVSFDKNMKLHKLSYLKEAGEEILLFKADKNQSGAKLWVMGEKYIGYIFNNKFKKITVNKAASAIQNYYAPNLIPSYYNSIVYSCSQSLILFEKDGKHSTKLTTENGLPQLGGLYMFLDKEMNIWIAGMRGVTQIVSMRFANYNSYNGLFEDEVTSVNEIKKGELIFGHHNGFSFLSGGKISYLKIKPAFQKQISFNRVLDITVDGKGNAYFAAAETGFGKLDKNKNISWLNTSPLPEVMSIELNSKGEIFCLTINSLYKYVNGSLTKVYSFEHEGTRARKLFFDKNDQVYIVTVNAGIVYSKDFNKWNYIRNGADSKVNNVYSFFIDEAQNKYAGTGAGLFKIDGDSLKKFNPANFEINRPVYFIARDTLKNYWFGINNGVLKWDGKSVRHFTKRTGLIGAETNRDAGFVCSNGCIWIGTDKGVSRYLSQFDDISKIARPVVAIDSIVVDKTSFKNNEQIVLPFSKNDITFKVCVLSFISEGDNILSYKLSGYDKNWQTVKGSKASRIRYTNLPAGEYSLKLKAVNVINQNSNIFSSQKIIIEKPFYQSYWFYAGVLFFSAFVTFIGFKQFERIHYSKKLENEVKARTLELRESENKYKSLLSNLQDGFFVIQEETVKMANAALAKMLGYELEELNDLYYERLISPDDLPFVMRSYRDRLSGKKVENEYEFKMLHKNGSRIFVNMNVNLSLYEGKIATVGTIKDISKRKRNEELLKKLSTAVKQSPNMVVITDQYGVIEYVNPMFTEVAGYTFEEVRNRNINIVKSGLIESGIYENMWETINKGELWKGELINKKKNGELYWVRTAISPITGANKRITHYLATQEDITFEKYASEEIQKGEKLISTVLNNVPVMIFAFDKEGIIYLVKGKILETLGFTQELVVGKSALRLFPKGSDVSKDLKRALNGESFTSLTGVRNHTFEVTYSPTFNAEKKYTGSLGVAYDITERKKHEIELISAKESAEKSDRLKSEFLAQMSHEIRTPINSILSFTTLLKEELKSSLPDDLLEGFLFIENGAKRLIRTIDLILNMSQIQTGTYQPYYSDLDLDKDILRNIITEFKGVAAEKKLDLIYNVSSDNNNIKGDSYALGQIFANLVDNAIKYTPAGKVEVELNRINGSITVKVSDTGIGISGEFLPFLFTPFTQEDTGYTRKFEGNGLGLALVKKYVEMNKADIKVESRKGKGTSFLVTFKSFNNSIS